MSIRLKIQYVRLEGAAHMTYIDAFPLGNLEVQELLGTDVRKDDLMPGVVGLGVRLEDRLVQPRLRLLYRADREDDNNPVVSLISKRVSNLYRYRRVVRVALNSLCIPVCPSSRTLYSS